MDARLRIFAGCFGCSSSCSSDAEAGEEAGEEADDEADEAAGRRSGRRSSQDEEARASSQGQAGRIIFADVLSNDLVHYIHSGFSERGLC